MQWCWSAWHHLQQGSQHHKILLVGMVPLDATGMLFELGTVIWSGVFECQAFQFQKRVWTRQATTTRGGGTSKTSLTCWMATCAVNTHYLGFVCPFADDEKSWIIYFRYPHINSLCFARCTGLGSHPQREQHTGKPGIVGHAVREA